MRIFGKFIVKYALIGFVILIIGGIGGVLFDHFAIPRLAAYPSLAKLGFLRDVTKTTTIINKTEQIQVQESDSVEKIALQAAGAVVNIVSVGKQPASGVKSVVTSASTIGNTGTVPSFMTGSGVIVTNDGVVATYRTAILESNAEYTVLLSDGTAYPASLFGIDPLTNVAFFRIQVGNVSAISFADSNDARPGKKLIALSNASEEYQNRYASGLLTDIDKTFNLSGKTVASSEKLEGVFKVDLASPEKSLGGPVINYNGELVGIVGSETVDGQDVYFVVPSNVVKQSLDLAIRARLGNRSVLGAYYVTITKIYALTHGLQRDRGALISVPSGKTSLAILAGSPAEKAGLKYGDIVTAVSGKEINLDNPLSGAIGQFSKGDKVQLLVVRDGKEMTVSVQL